jgi:subtilisin family serine protease
VIEPGTFPTRRVVAGVDLVGQGYDSASPVETDRVPHPDADPLDAYGHGTHVAGTIGGVGDGTNTYDGVAPEASLYAIKVFAKGSTDEAPIIAALEYAADPNADGDLSDRLDVVNLSLGSDWGSRLGLYTEVVSTLANGGTFFVASAGNSGPERYIVGSPSTADQALSVAASTDNSVATTPPDLLVGFSSWGPRSLDAILKPEIAAPGLRIISAKMGGGFLGRSMSGTSMASPHVTGVAALLRQAHPTATPADLKSMLMNSSLPMKDRNGAVYPVTETGAGRVQAYEAAVSPLVFSPPAVSLGMVSGNAVSQGTRTVTVTNVSSDPVHASVAWQAQGGLTLTGASAIDVPAGGTVNLDVAYSVDVTTATVVETQVEGQAVLSLDAHGEVPALTLRVPALAVATRASDLALTATPLGQGPVSVALANHGPIDGDALAFNLLAKEQVATARAGVCDLAAAGYRVVHQGDADYLQFGFDLASTQTTWNFCELSVQIDTDGDGIAEQEIGGTANENLRSPDFDGDPFGSFLIDATAMRTVEANLEQGMAGLSDFVATVQDVQPFVRYPLSTVSYLSADLSKVKRTAAGTIRVKVGVLAASEGASVDVFLSDGAWFDIDPAHVPFTAMADKVTAPASSSTTLALTSAGGSQSLLVFFPQNTASTGRSIIVDPSGAKPAVP